MPNRSLGAAARELFTEGLLTRAAAGRTEGLAPLRDRFFALLDQFWKDPRLQEFDPAEADHARFALVAWVDEVIGGAFAGDPQWSAQLLQLQIYRTNRAGDEFYERLEALAPDQLAAREIFLLCLLFGFEGRLAGQAGERNALLQEQFAALRAAGFTGEIAARQPLTPSAYDLEIDLRPDRRSGLIGIVGRWMVGALAVFGLLWLLLWWQAGSLPSAPGA